jgi:hypothetical protein
MCVLDSNRSWHRFGELFPKRTGIEDQYVLSTEVHELPSPRTSSIEPSKQCSHNVTTLIATPHKTYSAVTLFRYEIANTPRHVDWQCRVSGPDVSDEDAEIRTRCETGPITWIQDSKHQRVDWGGVHPHRVRVITNHFVTRCRHGAVGPSSIDVSGGLPIQNSSRGALKRPWSIATIPNSCLR